MTTPTPAEACLPALMDENAILARELAHAQRRCTEAARAHAAKTQAQDAALIRLRGALIRSETDKAGLRDRLASLEAATPDLRTRFELTRANHLQAERLAALQRELLQCQQERDRLQRLNDVARDEIAHLRTVVAGLPAPQARPLPGSAEALMNRAVLCVGGRTAAAPVYRHMVERTGGRFLHHDGEEQDGATRLDATLAAADLVICQTGCISHDAYWRVKDHCKRTGKPCVFVDAPSKAALERALDDLRHTPEHAPALPTAPG